MDLNALEAAELPPEDGPVAEATEDVCWVLPENWTALLVFLACQSQLELVVGVGGGCWRAAKSENVGRELLWLDVEPADQGKVVGQYRVIERELLRLMNEELSSRNR